MKNFNLSLNLAWLKDLLSIQSYYSDDTLMRSMLLDEVGAITDGVEEGVGVLIHYDPYGNMYVTKGIPEKGHFYPCIVAHIDTVQPIVKNNAVFYEQGILFAMDMDKVEQIGIGGDDKVGIYLALELLCELPACKVVFFRNEESGCLGSAQADMSFFKDCSFVLQGDRRGGGDFIHNSNGVQLYSKTFLRKLQPLFKEYKFKEEVGSITDVGELKENGLKICCANVSCGYYEAHSKEEYVFTYFVQNTLNLFYEICTTMTYKQWKHYVQKSTFLDDEFGWEGWPSSYYTEITNGVSTRKRIHSLPSSTYSQPLSNEEIEKLRKYKPEQGVPLLTTGNGVPVSLKDVVVGNVYPKLDEDPVSKWLWEVPQKKYVSAYANVHVLGICPVCDCTSIEIDNNDSGYICYVCDAHYDWGAAEEMTVPYDQLHWGTDDPMEDGVAVGADEGGENIVDEFAKEYNDYQRRKWEESDGDRLDS